jgi:Tetratricopeptide repeat
VLRRRALARVGTDSLQVHRLVGAILREGPISIPADNNDMTTIARQLLRGAVPAEPWDNLASWPVWHQLLPHVLAVTDPTRSADIAWLLARAAIYLLDRGESRPARALSERAHQLSRDTLGEDHPDTLLSASILTFVLRALGEHEQARHLEEWITSQPRS